MWRDAKPGQRAVGEEKKEGEREERGKRLIANHNSDCGAEGINCLAQTPRFSGCVGYPALGEYLGEGRGCAVVALGLMSGE